MKRLSVFLLSAFFASSIFIFPVQANDYGTDDSNAAAMPMANYSRMKDSKAETATLPTAEQVTCVQDALDARDTSLLTAYDTFTAAVKSALGTRTGDLKAAWAKATVAEIKTALKDTWMAYRKSMMQARMTLRKAKVAAWKEFRTDRKACFAGSETGLDGSDMMSDAQL